MSARKGSGSAAMPSALSAQSHTHRTEAARNVREAAHDAASKAEQRARQIKEAATAERDAVLAQVEAELAACAAALETALARDFRSTIDPLIRTWRNERTHREAARLQAALADFGQRCMHDLGHPLCEFPFVCALACAVGVQLDPIGLVEASARFMKSSQAALVATLSDLEIAIESRARSFDPRMNFEMVSRAMTRESFQAARAWRAPPAAPGPYQGRAAIA